MVGGGLVALDAARTAMRALLPGHVMAAEEEEAVEAGTMRVALDVAREAITARSLEGHGREPRVRRRDASDEIGAGTRRDRDHAHEGVAFQPSGDRGA